MVLCQNQTPASGEYEIENLEAGEYWVEFIPPGGSGYLVEHWNNVPFGGTPTTIELAEGEDLTGIDAELGKGGEIKGQVTALGGGPLESGRGLREVGRRRGGIKLLRAGWRRR